MKKSLQHLFASLVAVWRSGLLGHCDFRWMWLSATTTSFGGQVTILALPLTAVTLLDASPSQMGVLVALEAVPFTLFSLHVGVFIDRVRKLPVLVACEAAIGLTLFVVPLAAWFGVLSMAVMYGVGFLLGTAFVVVGTASQVFLTQLAGRDRLIEANSLFVASDSVARLTGPGLAGLMIQWLSAPFAIVVDCIGFVVSFVFLTRIRVVEAAPATRPIAAWREIREGLVLVLGHPILRPLTLASTAWFVLFQGFLALELIFASRDLDLSAGQIGAAHMFGGSGALVSAIAARHATRRFGMGAPILFGIFCSGVAWMLLAAVPRSDHAFLLMGASLFFFDFGVMLYWINYASLRQAVTPDAMLGRMTATMRFFTVAAAPQGAWCAGLAGERFGLRATLFAVGAGVVAMSSALYALSNLRHVPDLSLSADLAEKRPRQDKAATA